MRFFILYYAILDKQKYYRLFLKIGNDLFLDFSFRSWFNDFTGYAIKTGFVPGGIQFFLAFTIKFCLNKFTGPTPVERCECVTGFFYTKHRLKKQAKPVIFFIDLLQALRLTDLDKMFHQF